MLRGDGEKITNWMINYKIHASASFALTFQYFICLYFSLVLPGNPIVLFLGGL
jgi:hypothetical protein